MSYLEDIKVGVNRELGSFTFTAQAIKDFARQFDPQPFHLDEEAGRASLFGGLAASGWHLTAVFMKLLIANAQREQAAAKARGEDIAPGGPSPGFKNMRWLKPVLAGDTLTYFTEVKATRLSASRPQWGIMEGEITAYNQRGELVFSFENAAFMPRRNPAA